MRFPILLVIAISIVGCQTSNIKPLDKEAFSIDSVRAYIFKMNKGYSERFVSNDSNFFNERYCIDAAVHSPNMPTVVGRDSIRSFFYNGGKNTEAKIELPNVNIFGNEELVVEDGIYHFPDGKGGSLDKGKFIAVWKQEGGKWKIYRETWNSDISPQ